MKRKFRWMPKVGEDFEKLNEQGETKPILQLLNFHKVFTIGCEASGIVVGGVLSQEGRSVTFFSENMNEDKEKYSSYDL